MDLVIKPTKQESGRIAAEHGAQLIRDAIAQRGEANMIVATGASQFEMIEQLIQATDIRWDKVTVFHLDEYVGMPITHGASFRKYLWERFHSKLPLPVRAFHYLNAETDPQAEARRVGELIGRCTIDVCFAGIGENGHLAFNDPPADFDTTAPYLIVGLDEACRRQQLGEGWFPTLADVPTQAISMSVREIMRSRAVICTVPDQRKAAAVQMCVEGDVVNMAPASILQRHDNCTLYLDAAAASLLSTSDTPAGA